MLGENDALQRHAHGDSRQTRARVSRDAHAQCERVAGPRARAECVPRSIAGSRRHAHGQRRAVGRHSRIVVGEDLVSPKPLTLTQFMNGCSMCCARRRRWRRPLLHPSATNARCLAVASNERPPISVRWHALSYTMTNAACTSASAGARRWSPRCCLLTSSRHATHRRPGSVRRQRD